MRVAPYILAGGLSSRMGRDKAMIVLGGKTLLARAVETVRSALESGSGTAGLAIDETLPIRVTVIGNRTLLEGADRAIPDKYPGRGPLGGIETALSDLEATHAADWALFLPVDMPFLPSGLITALLREWEAAGHEGARACHVMVDDMPQPLVSVIHRELHPFLIKAIEEGHLKVTPVLQSACKAVAYQSAQTIGSSASAVWLTRFKSRQTCPIDIDWHPTEVQRQSRSLWFSNLNTSENLRDAETFPWQEGFIGR